MSVKLLTEHHLEVLNLKGGCTGTSESTLVKMQHCWKSHDTAHIALKVHTTIRIYQWYEDRIESLSLALRGIPRDDQW